MKTKAKTKTPKPKSRSAKWYKIAQIPQDYYDNNMVFCVKNGNYVGLSLNNKFSNRTANILIIGGSGTGKTYKYVKPNIMQENCSQVITDPSGDIFRSFAPYLMSRGYNVYLFNVNDFTLSNNYNPLENVFDVDGNVIEKQVDMLVELFVKNVKNSQEAKSNAGGDPFWDGAEKNLITALIYYLLEEDQELLIKGFEASYSRPVKRGEKPAPEQLDENGDVIEKAEVQGYAGGRCFNTVLKLALEAEVSEDSNKKSPLTIRMEDFFRRNPKNKTYSYYKTFANCKSEKTASTIVLCTTLDLRLFATTELDLVTRTNPIKEMNIDFDRIGSQQSYLFLGIPQDDQTYNFLVAMLQAQLFKRLYQLGDKKMRGKWHIGYRVGTPIFDFFYSEEEAKCFYETVTEQHIVESRYINGQTMYKIHFNGRDMKVSPVRQVLVDLINSIGEMYIWSGDKVAGSDPALPIHVNFLLDEFKNIGAIPNFLNYLATVRKYRIGLHIIIQDIGQIKTMYKEQEHETLLANVDTTIFLGSILPEDKEYIQKMLGKTTIKQRSTSDSKTGQSISYTPTEVPLMTLDEISAINNPNDNRDDCIVIVRDCDPIVGRKLLLNEHCRAKLVDKAKDVINIELFWRNNNEGQIEAKAEGE